MANGGVLRAVASFVAFTIVLHGAWLAAIVFTFNAGGTTEAGVVAFSVLVPGALLSPFVAVWFDRLAPNRALASGYALQGLILFAVAALTALSISRFAVYAVLGAFVVAQMASRPTMSSILPRLVLDPAQLAAANSAIGLVETLGLVLGPAVVALLFYVSNSVAMVFLLSAGLMMMAALLSLTIDASATEAERVDDNPDIESALAKVRAGVSLLRSNSAPLTLVLVASTMRLIVGVLEVGVVVIAIEHLGRSEATAGVLGTAIGVGAIAGSALTFLFVGRRRISPFVALGVLCASAPIALVAATEGLWPVLLLLGISGLGRPIVEVGARTLLQGLSTDDMLARLFGLLEGLSLLILSIGSILFAILSAFLGFEAALAISGALPCVVTLLLIGKLRQIDSDRPQVDATLLATMRRIPIFSPLAAFRIEQIVVNMELREFGPLQQVFAAGDEGDLLFVVVGGWAHIDLRDEPVGARTGGFFGEIALLRNQPRMATVSAGSEGLTTYTLDRQTFLEAVMSAPQSHARSHRLVERRLGEA